ncbi:recombinase family protein [Phenylobacterium sp.]|uniref:recombinase family protein n=1 Tax=Phenylobacterium sp. TaxID=1871053 RepID=UPI002DEF8495|nr:recombinase family protein [Phenylobacterium sp.]
MAEPQSFIAYYRVSTDRQGRSGLGLDAQRDTVRRHIDHQAGELLAEFTEVESGKRSDRPQLHAALTACRTHRAVLIIAKLDRLARNARFLLTIVEGAGDEGVVFCDLPHVPAGPVGKFMLTQLAAVAELEAGLISQRTKDALRAAKAKGTKLGNPSLIAGSPIQALRASAVASARAKAWARDVLPYIEAARKAGAVTLSDLAEALECRGVRAARGGTRWSPSQVQRILSTSTE